MRPFEVGEEDVQTAMVALISPFTRFRCFTKLSDLTLLKDTGCLFTTSAADQIQRLLDLVGVAVLSESSPKSGDEQSGPYSGVFLTLKDGREVILQLQMAFRGHDVMQGAVSRDSGKSWTGLVVASSLPIDLFHWAAAVGKPMTNSQYRSAMCESWFDEKNLKHPWMVASK